jgi:glycine/D-amino acid oxidase-like deaminating enzyme/nitrite reductase/ring-hydroxylating ferredoxin subunit
VHGARGILLALCRRMDAVESTESLWKLHPPSTRSSLARDAACDVCVIGAGITGLSVAYDLAREGRQVIVLDARDLGAGQTAQTTAHLASALDDRFSELERVFGEHGARLAYASHARAIDEIEANVRKESIDCGFTRLDGYLFLGPGQKDKLLEDELDAARRIGFPGVARAVRAPLSAFDTGSCLVFPNQGRFHPLRYMTGLASAAERFGAAIYTQTRVIEVKGGKQPSVRTSEGFVVRAGAVVVATNSPIHLRTAIHSKQAPYRTYAVTLRVPSGAVFDALYWDTCDPYHYVRLEPDGEPTGLSSLIVGGEDHRTASADDAPERYQRLEQWARERFPMAGEVVFRWSGQVLEPFDHLAFIGRDPTGERNVYLSTGDSGHGMTHGTVAGLLLTDLVLGRENPWESIYDPSRKRIRAAREYVRDNLEVAAEYAKWLVPAGGESAGELASGEGTVVQRGRRKIALYRDPTGALHERSAVCTHLGCTVHWNSDAKSWDCRCHGSRFAPTGEVLNGPARSALHRVDDVRKRSGGRLRSTALGAVGGAVATFAMSAAMMVQKKVGLLGEPPPRKIVRALRLRSGIIGTSREAENAATILAHWGFGIATGALFGLLHRGRRGTARSSVLGAAYGAAVWAANYYGWIPALGIMRAPHRDRPARPTSMVAAHLVFGSVLGVFMERLSPPLGSRRFNASRVAPGI